MIVSRVAVCALCVFACLRDRGQFIHANDGPAALLLSPDPPLPCYAQRVFPQLQFAEPVAMVDLGRHRYRAVLERKGKVVVFDRSDDPSRSWELLDLSTLDANIAGCRDLQVDPAFDENGFIYLFWSINPHLVEGGSRVSRFTIQFQDPPKIDPQSRLDIITYPSGDHVGASLCFGSDKMLYIGTGDGSLPFPPDALRLAQDLRDLRGSILRVDVRNATAESPYLIPADNPFVSLPLARGEIFSYGVRNAFRMDFNPATGSLWIADVGWERCEMIHRSFAGANHGWSLFEGPYAVNLDQTSGPTPLVPPAIVMPRAEAQSITGGVFTADNSVALPNRYLFGDYMNGSVWAADLRDESKPSYTKIADTKLRVVDFHQTLLDKHDDKPCTLMVDIASGGIFELLVLEKVSAPESRSDQDAHASNKFPRRLSETGLFESTADMTLAKHVYPYQPTAVMWRDGAKGEYAAYFPAKPTDVAAKLAPKDYLRGTVFINTLSRVLENGVLEKVSTPDSGNGPAGALLYRSKTPFPQPTRMETQLLVYDGLNWNPYSYAWNAEQTDATLVPEAGFEVPIQFIDPDLGPQQAVHQFQSRNQCKVCHHVFMHGPISFSPTNLVSGQSGKMSWDDFVAKGFAKAAIPSARFVAVDDGSASLNDRARSYLDINCSHCHRPAGGGTSGLHLQHWVAPEKMSAINSPPTQGDFGISEPRIIAAGMPERSVMMYRVATCGPGHMPHLGSRLPDLQGVTLLWDWIASLEPKSDLPAQGDTSPALLAWRQLANKPFDQAKNLAEIHSENATSAIQAGIFGAWIPNDKQLDRVPANPDVDELLRMQGDADVGQRWFFGAVGSQCRSCHQIGGLGSTNGPPLDSLGQRSDRRAIYRQILFPSEQVAPQWQTSTILNADGSVHLGVITEQNDTQIRLRLADGQETSINKQEVEAIQLSSKSTMPEGQAGYMTKQELADLVEYLFTASSNLKQ